MQTTRRLLMAVIAALGLAACSAAEAVHSAAPQILAVEGATIIGTGKTVGDHVVSFMSGKDCSTIRKNLGRTYCEEDEIGHMDEVYCYRTLGKVSCYAVPAPHGETQRTVDHMPTHAGPPR